MTTALATRPPAALEAALTEMTRRLTEAASAGRTTSDAAPSIVVINDAVNGLNDAAVLDAVLRLARMAPNANMSIELRGHILPNSTGFREACGGLLAEDLGGSAELREMVNGECPWVYYRCLRPFRGVPYTMLKAGETAVVHNDPRVLASGRTDTGVFVRFHDDRTWVYVQFAGEVSELCLLASDLLVEVTPE